MTSSINNATQMTPYQFNDLCNDDTDIPSMWIESFIIDNIGHFAMIKKIIVTPHNLVVKYDAVNPNSDSDDDDIPNQFICFRWTPQGILVVSPSGFMNSTANSIMFNTTTIHPHILSYIMPLDD